MKNCIYGAAIFIAACFSCTSPKAKECVVEGEVKGYGDGFFCVMTETLDDYDVDTVEVKNGHFTYRSSIEHPTQLTFLAIDNAAWRQAGYLLFPFACRKCKYSDSGESRGGKKIGECRDYR